MSAGSSVSAARNATVGVAAWSAGTCSATDDTAGSATAAASTTSTEVTPLRARWVRQISAENGCGSRATYRAAGAARPPCTAKYPTLVPSSSTDSRVPAEGPPPGQQLRLPALLAGPVQLLEHLRVRRRGTRARGVDQPEARDRARDPGAVQPAERRPAQRATATRLPAGGPAQPVGDRDGQPADAARRSVVAPGSQARRVAAEGDRRSPRPGRPGRRRGARPARRRAGRAATGRRPRR